MLIESFGLMKDYPFLLLISKNISNLAVQQARLPFRLMKYYFFSFFISKKISNLAVQVKTATEPSGASVALLGSRLKVEIKPEMEARHQKITLGINSGFRKIVRNALKQKRYSRPNLLLE